MYEQVAHLRRQRSKYLSQTQMMVVLTQSTHVLVVPEVTRIVDVRERA
jgi:hypothetical protein